MDTAGKAVLFSGVTVLISLSAVMLVPSPAFRSMSLGIMVSVVFVLAATLTLLPPCSPSSGRGSTSSPCPGCTAASTARRASPRWGERLWRRPLLLGGVAAGRAGRAVAAGARAWTPGCRRSRSCPRATRSRQGYEQIQAAFGAGRAGHAAGRRAAAARPTPPPLALGADPGIARVVPAAARRRRPGADRGGPDRRSLEPGARRRRSTACATRPAGGRPGRRRRRPRTTTSRRRWPARRRW